MNKKLGALNNPPFQAGYLAMNVITFTAVQEYI